MEGLMNFRFHQRTLHCSKYKKIHTCNITCYIYFIECLKVHLTSDALALNILLLSPFLQIASLLYMLQYLTFSLLNWLLLLFQIYFTSNNSAPMCYHAAADQILIRDLLLPWLLLPHIKQWTCHTKPVIESKSQGYWFQTLEGIEDRGDPKSTQSCKQWTANIWPGGLPAWQYHQKLILTS